MNDEGNYKKNFSKTKMQTQSKIMKVSFDFNLSLTNKLDVTTSVCRVKVSE